MQQWAILCEVARNISDLLAKVCNRKKVQEDLFHLKKQWTIYNALVRCRAKKRLGDKGKGEGI